MESWGETVIMKKKESMADQVHDKILEMIIKAPIEEESVLTERSLMERFDVGKAPVREALIKLCSEGVIRSIPRFGYAIVQLKEKDIESVVCTRVLLELECLRASFKNIVDNHLEEIRSYLDGVDEKTDAWEIWEDNHEFHMLLASFSDNTLLPHFVEECLNMQKRVYAQIVWKSKQSFGEHIDRTPHEEIYRALKDNNLEEALQVLERDINGYLS